MAIASCGTRRLGTKVSDAGRHQGSVYTLGFGRDARTLVSGGTDGACYLWDLRPSGNRPVEDPERLWLDLTGEDGAAAHRAIWALSDMRDRAVPLVAERLGKVTSVIDLDRIPEGIPREEVDRRRRMRRVPGRQGPQGRIGAGRQAGHLGPGLGSAPRPPSRRSSALADREPKGEVSRLAAAGLNRLDATGRR